MNEALKEKISQELLGAAEQISREITPELIELIPDGGMELVYALSGARTPDDVGTCLLFLDGTEMSSPSIRFEHPSQMVSGILTALRFSPEIRCACSIRHSEKLKKIAEDMLLETCMCTSGKIPPGVSTMDWAVAFCSEQDSGVPDILFIETDKKTPAQARLFGEKPGSVATNLIKISQRIIDATH